MLGLFVRRRQYIWLMHRRAWARRRPTLALHVIGHRWRRCRIAGMVFLPMVFESLGGVSTEAERVIKSLNRMVAENQDTPYGEVATRFWQRLSIDLQRAGHRAFSRRVARGKDLEGEGMGVFSGSGVFLTEAEGSLHA